MNGDGNNNNDNNNSNSNNNMSVDESTRLEWMWHVNPLKISRIQSGTECAILQYYLMVIKPCVQYTVQIHTLHKHTNMTSCLLKKPYCYTI